MEAQACILSFLLGYVSLNPLHPNRSICISGDPPGGGVFKESRPRPDVGKSWSGWWGFDRGGGNGWSRPSHRVSGVSAGCTRISTHPCRDAGFSYKFVIRLRDNPCGFPPVSIRVSPLAGFQPIVQKPCGINLGFCLRIGTDDLVPGGDHGSSCVAWIVRRPAASVLNRSIYSGDHVRTFGLRIGVDFRSGVGESRYHHPFDSHFADFVTIR